MGIKYFVMFLISVMILTFLLMGIDIYYKLEIFEKPESFGEILGQLLIVYFVLVFTLFVCLSFLVFAINGLFKTKKLLNSYLLKWETLLMQTKDNKKKIFFFVTAAALILAIIYVPYIQYHLFHVSGGQPMEIIQETGFMFVGDLPFMAKINTMMLFIEIIVILSIAFGFYFLVLKDKK